MLGYGYGILNSLIVTLALLISFAILMLGQAQSNSRTHLDFIEMIYFSIVSFTTVGYGEITPIHETFALSITIAFLFLSVAWGAIVTAVIVKRLVR
ncbi:ion channel [Aliamphritea spongicola]